jgi:hypothetical protein
MAMIEEAGVQFRPARLEDVEQIREAVRFTLANPEGKTLRKRYEDAVARNEVLVLARFDVKTQTSTLIGFIEWHTRVDGAVTVRDAGTTGEAPQLPILKRLLRELLRHLRPPSVGVKVRSDQEIWNDVFKQTTGFIPGGTEYSRPHWRTIYTWTPEYERLATRLAKTPPAPLPPMPRRRPPLPPRPQSDESRRREA